MIRTADQCKEDGCIRIRKARGWCAAHYEANRRGTTLTSTGKTKRRSSTFQHKLSDLDAESLMATCVSCGWTEVYYRPDRNIYVCIAGKRLSQADYMLRRVYGITVEQKIELWESQNKQCAICFREIDLFDCHVDHNHDTKAVRSLLCGPCNKGIGLLQEDVEVLKSAIKYLIQHNSN